MRQSGGEGFVCSEIALVKINSCSVHLMQSKIYAFFKETFLDTFVIFTEFEAQKIKFSFISLL